MDASNQLLLTLFGIKENINIPLVHLSEHLYIQHSDCAKYVLARMNELSLRVSRAYPTETVGGLKHNIPGHSLYVIQKYQVSEVSFEAVF